MLFDCCGRIPLLLDAKVFPDIVEKENRCGIANCSFIYYSFHHIHEARKMMGC